MHEKFTHTHTHTHICGKHVLGLRTDSHTSPMGTGTVYLSHYTVGVSGNVLIQKTGERPVCSYQRALMFVFCAIVFNATLYTGHWNLRAEDRPENSASAPTPCTSLWTMNMNVTLYTQTKAWNLFLSEALSFPNYRQFYSDVDFVHCFIHCYAKFWMP